MTTPHTPPASLSGEYPAQAPVHEPQPPVEILIVDDRPENLLALEAILEPLGQTLVRATSGDDALRKLLTHDVAAILLDVQMPGMNGFEAARLIKAREKSRFIPIIFLTAISKDEEYVFEGYSVGAVDYLAKPFQPDILRSKVSVFVDLYQKQRQLAEQQQLLAESERRDLELRHMRELYESEARFSEIVGSAMDAIVVFDTDGFIRLFNTAAERMFGVAVDTVMETDVRRFLPESRQKELLDAICNQSDPDRNGDGGAAGHVLNFEAIREGGETFPVEATASCLDVRGKRTFTLIIRDISERKRAERELQQQADSLARAMDELKGLNDELAERQTELERAMAARSRFYASMSHELRTPINAVLGYSTLLLENIYGPLNEKQAEGISRTHKAAKHLLELVNDVLDLSKIEAGKIDLRLQPVAFPGLIEDLFVTVRPLADQYGSPLSLEHEGEPMKIISDPRRLRQILLNLLSNAIKFGRGNPIRVRSIPKEDKGGITIEVIDQGEGIAPNDREKIFDEFVQLGKTQLTEGTGLGLPISRRLAEMLDGTMEIESEVGVGSVFRLTVPAAVPEQSLRAARPLDQEMPSQAASNGDAASRERTGTDESRAPSHSAAGAD